MTDVLGKRTLGRMIVILVLGTISTLLMVVQPQLIGLGVDALSGGSAQTHVWGWVHTLVSSLAHTTSLSMVLAVSVALLILVILYSAVECAFSFLQQRNAEQTLIELRHRLLTGIMAPDFRSPLTTGDLINVCTRNCEGVKDLVNSVPATFTMFLHIVASIAVLARLGWQVAVVVLLPLPFVAVANTYLFGRFIGFRRANVQYEGQITNTVKENVSQAATITGLGASAYGLKRTRTRDEERYRNLIRQFPIGWGANQLITITEVGGIVLLLWISGVIGSFSPGDLTLAIQYCLRIYPLAAFVPRTLTSLMDCWANLERVRQVLQTKHHHGQDPLADGELAVENVVVQRANTEVLNLPILKFQPGDLVALTGPNGAGKSTLFGLLAGLETPPQGTVTVAGRPLRDLDELALRRSVFFLTETPPIFAGTIRENLALWGEQTDGELWDVLEAVGLAANVRERPEGLSAPIGVDGSALSLGQRQRLNVARILLRDPRIVLLDEALSGIDDRDFGTMLRLLAHPQRIVVITSHRDDLTQYCTRVVRLVNGQIVEDAPVTAAQPAV